MRYKNAIMMMMMMIIIVIIIICHTIIEITNNIGKVETKWRGDLTETIGLELFNIS